MGRDQCLRTQPVTVSGNAVLFFAQIMMNAVTKVITAMRMQHVLIPLDTLNAYVTQGLLEMGVSVQVKLPFFSHFYVAVVLGSSLFVTVVLFCSKKDTKSHLVF